MDFLSRRYGSVVEDYLDTYLRTPGVPKDDIARALVARGRARKDAGQRLLLMASRGQCQFSGITSMQPADCVLFSRSPAVWFYNASQTFTKRQPLTLLTKNSSSTGVRTLQSVLPLFRLQRDLYLPLETPFNRPGLSAHPSGNLGPDRELHPPVLPPHVAIRVFLPSRYRSPSHLSHS